MNKMLKTVLAAALAACSAVNLTGCSESRRETDNLLLGAEVSKTQYSAITLGDNNTLNSIRLFDAVSKDKMNAMFSPLSLNMALGLIEAGANGDTKAQISAYLQTENYADFAERYLKHAHEDLTKDFGKGMNTVEIANSFWADNTLPLKEEYKSGISGRFAAEVSNLDFADKSGTVKRINGWVNEKTHKMIPTIIDDYTEDLAAVVVNTVYFESEWSGEWRINENEKERFTLLDGSTKELPLMYNGGDIYYENDRAEAFGNYYKNNLLFIGILPKDSGEFTLESLDIPSLLAGESTEYDVSVGMPRLNFETALPLKDALAAAGLTDMFDEEKADLSNISDASLFLSDILQKTCLELDEKKTKAAAVTRGSINLAVASPRERKTVRLDRPFAFMIYDSAEDQILFLGKVTEP